MATRGQPTKKPWERRRAIAWTHEVQRLAQEKMEQIAQAKIEHIAQAIMKQKAQATMKQTAQAKMKQTQLPASDPFTSSAKLIQTRWDSRGPNQKPGVVTMTDLDEVLLGSKRTDFSNYSKGAKARPRTSTLEAVDNKVPGTKMFFEVGPNDVPIWAALRGRITPDDFWEPLVRSGQITDAFDLFLEDMDWQIEARTSPRLSLVGTRGTVLNQHQADVLKALILYESNRLSLMPLKYLVNTLAHHLVPRQLREGQPLDASEVEANARFLLITMGEAVLAIALAQMAKAHRYSSKYCPKESCEDLRNILEGLIPIWQRWESFYNLGTAISDEIKQLSALL